MALKTQLMLKFEMRTFLNMAVLWNSIYSRNVSYIDKSTIPSVNSSQFGMYTKLIRCPTRGKVLFSMPLLTFNSLYDSRLELQKHIKLNIISKTDLNL